MEQTKNYLGNGWQQSKQNEPFFYNVQLEKEKIENLPANDKGYVRLSITNKREPDARSRATHNIYEPIKNDRFAEFDFSFLKSEALQNCNRYNKIQLTVSPISADIKKEKNFNSDYFVTTNPYGINNDEKKVIGNGWQNENKLEFAGGVWQNTHEGNTFYNVSLNKSTLEKIPANEKGFVALSISEKNNNNNIDPKTPSHNIYKSIGKNNNNSIINISVNKKEALKNHNGKGNILLSVTLNNEKTINSDYYVKTTGFENQNQDFDPEKAVIGNGWNNELKKEQKQEKEKKTETKQAKGKEKQSSKKNDAKQKQAKTNSTKTKTSSKSKKAGMNM